jgi:hypothetical protein
MDGCMHASAEKLAFQLLCEQTFPTNLRQRAVKLPVALGGYRQFLARQAGP